MMPRPLAGNKPVTNTSWTTMSTSTAPSTRRTTVMRLRLGAAQWGSLDGGLADVMWSALPDVMWSMSWRARSGSFNRMVP